MDCSKTEVFLNEFRRMCLTYDMCEPCEARKQDACPTLHNSLGRYSDKILKKQIEIVQKWSDEHPQETVLEHFKKILPNMVIFRALDGKERINCCPDSLDSRISRNNCDDLLCKKYPCGDCWNRPYEKAIKGKVFPENA